MDAASSGRPARGITYGRLVESNTDRIVVGGGGGALFYLPEGMTCTYPVGTRLKVVYSERDGRKNVENITLDRGVWA